MRLEQLALWTPRLETLRDFYARHLGCTSSPLYKSRTHPFRSYFLAFPEGGARIELMETPSLAEVPAGAAPDRAGLAHFALTLGGEESMPEVTERRRASDGYYVLDPDGNRIEFTA